MKKIFGIVLLVLLSGVIGYRVITHGEEPAIKDIDAYQEELGIPVEIETMQRGNLTVSRHLPEQLRESGRLTPSPTQLKKSSQFRLKSEMK